ncbi:MAG: 1-acyl-sn-glycerol-3-phosphate acyltransferase [Deltaproteobacteria bacterium]|nr:MAG: 1-acyl-sn-glycerol-3-phosphate acyltransferase [Deltaproteobacteria bacterium]
MGGRKNWVFTITKAVSRVLLASLFRLETDGTDNLPRGTSFILLPKHQRWEDIPLLSLATPRPLYYVARYDLFDNLLSNWFFRSLGGIPLNRQRPLESRRSLQAILECLKRGEGVVVFPEGTYHRNTMGPARVGIVRLILSRFSVPFIPVGIYYSRKRIRTLVRINFGRAFFPDPAASASAFLDTVMKEIAVLSGLS